MATAGALGGFVVLFLIVLAILWCFVPFLIMGTNSRLSKLIKQQEELIDLLKSR